MRSFFLLAYSLVSFVSGSPVDIVAPSVDVVSASITYKGKLLHFDAISSAVLSASDDTSAPARITYTIVVEPANGKLGDCDIES